MGAMQRRKGKVFERKIAQTFRAVFPEAKRTLTQTRDSGEEPDINVPGWWIECKAHQKVPIRKAFDQAVDEAKRANSKAKPIAVTQDNRTEPLVTLRLTDFLGLLKKIEKQLDENAASPPLMVVEEGKAPTQVVEVEVFKPAQPSAD